MVKIIPENFDDIPETDDVDEIKALLKFRHGITAFLQQEEKKEKASVARAKARRIENSRVRLSELESVDIRLTQLLVQKKRFLWSRHGKTIRFPGGTIRYVVNAKSLDTPKNTSPIITALLAIRSGKKFVTMTPKLDRDGLANSASEELIRKLKPLGVWVGKHSLISVKSDGEEDPTILVRRRYHAPQK
jgi:hypothetical protein